MHDDHVDAGSRGGAQLSLFVPGTDDNAVTSVAKQGRPEYLLETAAMYRDYLLASGRATHTVSSVLLDLRGLVEHLGDVPLSGVTPAQLRAHVRWLRTDRHNGTASLRRKIATLKGFFQYGVASGWIIDNPAAPLIYPAPQRPPIIALDPAEAERVVRAGTHDLSWHALVLLLLDAGLKRDEMLALEAEDLYLARDPAHSQLTVRRSAQAKRVRHRSIPLTPRAHFALARLAEAPREPGPLLAISVRGVNFVVETVGRRSEIARIKKLTPEILRDTFAVRAMGSRIEAEGAAAERGSTERELERLRLEHDAEVLQLLGLSRFSDMAGRYRAAVAAARQKLSEDRHSSPPSGTKKLAEVAEPTDLK